MDMEIYKVNIETTEKQYVTEGWEILDSHWQGGILVQEYAEDSLLRRLDETETTLKEFGRLLFGERQTLLSVSHKMAINWLLQNTMDLIEYQS